MMNSIDATLLMLWHPAIRLIVQERAGSASRVSTLCSPDVTVHDQISQAFPLHIFTASDQKILEVGRAWE